MEVSIKTKDVNNSDQEMTLKLPAHALKAMQASLTSFGQTGELRESGSTYGRFTRDLSPMQSRGQMWRNQQPVDPNLTSRSQRSIAKSVERMPLGLTQPRLDFQDNSEEDERDIKDKRTQLIKDLIDTRVFTPKFWDLDCSNIGGEFGNTTLFGQTQDPVLLGASQLKSTGRFLPNNPNSQRSFRFGAHQNDGYSAPGKKNGDQEAGGRDHGFGFTGPVSSRTMGPSITSKLKTSNPAFQAAIEATLSKFDKDMDNIFQRPERRNEPEPQCFEDRSLEGEEEVLSKKTFNLGTSTLPTPISSIPVGFFKKNLPEEISEQAESSDGTRSAKDFLKKMSGVPTDKQPLQNRQTGAPNRPTTSSNNRAGPVHQQPRPITGPMVMNAGHVVKNKAADEDAIENKYRQWLDDTKKTVERASQEARRPSTSNNTNSAGHFGYQNFQQGIVNQGLYGNHNGQGMNSNHSIEQQLHPLNNVRREIILKGNDQEFDKDGEEYCVVVNYDSSRYGSEYNSSGPLPKDTVAKRGSTGFLGGQLVQKPDLFQQKMKPLQIGENFRGNTVDDGYLLSVNRESNLIASPSKSHESPNKGTRGQREQSKGKLMKFSGLKLDIEAIDAEEPATPSMTDGTMLDDVGLDTPVMKALSSIQGKIAELNLLMGKSSAVKTAEKTLPRLDFDANIQRRETHFEDLEENVTGGSFWKIEDEDGGRFSHGKYELMLEGQILSAEKTNERAPRGQDPASKVELLGYPSKGIHLMAGNSDLASSIVVHQPNMKREVQKDSPKRATDKENCEPKEEESFTVSEKVAKHLQNSQSLIDKLKRASVSSQFWH